MDRTSMELGISFTCKKSYKKQSIKWEDFVCDICSHIKAGKEQSLQHLLETPEIFFDEQCLETNIHDYQESFNFPLMEYPIVFKSDSEQFSKINKMYRKYFKKNITHELWEYYRDKNNKGVSFSTIEKIFKFEAPNYDYIPVFIIHKNMITQLKYLEVLESVLGLHFYYCFTFHNKRVEKWLEDHHGASMKSRNFQYYDLREDCSNLFPHWSNSTYSLIIDEMNVHVALLYYLFHLLSKYDINYITPYTLDENGEYYDPTQLVCDPLLNPTQFKQLQEIDAAFGGFCIVKSEYLEGHTWTDRKYKGLCEEIKDNKFLFKF